jgi:predicted nucleotidyltransferase
MALPEFNEFGDLPAGNHPASLAEVFSRFGSGTSRRAAITDRLRRIYELATATGHLDRLIVFGSYVSDVTEPNDVDVILVMRNDFRSEQCPSESAVLFDHARANDELGASIFWVRPDMLLGEPLDQFLAFWQTKRDGRRRGIVEVQS